MNNSSPKWLHWTPRVLAILLIAFMMLFSLDVFVEGNALDEMLIGFLLHNLPAFAVLIGLALAWRAPRLGGAFLLLLAIGFSIWWGIAALVILVPLYIVAFLFLADSSMQLRLAS